MLTGFGWRCNELGEFFAVFNWLAFCREMNRFTWKIIFWTVDLIGFRYRSAEDDCPKQWIHGFLIIFDGINCFCAIDGFPFAILLKWS